MKFGITPPWRQKEPEFVAFNCAMLHEQAVEDCINHLRADAQAAHDFIQQILEGDVNVRYEGELMLPSDQVRIYNAIKGGRNYV